MTKIYDECVLTHKLKKKLSKIAYYEHHAFSSYVCLYWGDQTFIKNKNKLYLPLLKFSQTYFSIEEYSVMTPKWGIILLNWV